MKLMIVDDEARSAGRLERFCRELLGPRLETLRVASTFDEAAACLDTAPIDLLLLDLNLRGEDGMDLLARCVAGSFHTIIVSAATEQALRAFDYGVLDFVPKPFGAERLAQAFRRLDDHAGRAAHPARRLA